MINIIYGGLILVKNKKCYFFQFNNIIVLKISKSQFLFRVGREFFECLKIHARFALLTDHNFIINLINFGLGQGFILEVLN